MLCPAFVKLAERISKKLPTALERTNASDAVFLTPDSGMAGLVSKRHRCLHLDQRTDRRAIPPAKRGPAYQPASARSLRQKVTRYPVGIERKTDRCVGAYLQARYR